ncbi:uncharacterized protein [Argopecten irradians]|uniref:uncharacterized protein isoform X2 n=1 Tax=Argopecten irradians TaxID=31199 RepID=UPI003724AC26
MLTRYRDAIEITMLLIYGLFMWNTGAYAIIGDFYEPDDIVEEPYHITSFQGVIDNFLCEKEVESTPCYTYIWPFFMPQKNLDINRFLFEKIERRHHQRNTHSGGLSTWFSMETMPRYMPPVFSQGFSTQFSDLFSLRPSNVKKQTFELFSEPLILQKESLEHSFGYYLNNELSRLSSHLQKTFDHTLAVKTEEHDMEGHDYSNNSWKLGHMSFVHYEDWQNLSQLQTFLNDHRSPLNQIQTNLNELRSNLGQMQPYRNEYRSNFSCMQTSLNERQLNLGRIQSFSTKEWLNCSHINTSFSYNHRSKFSHIQRFSPKPRLYKTFPYKYQSNLSQLQSNYSDIHSFLIRKHRLSFNFKQIISNENQMDIDNIHRTIHGLFLPMECNYPDHWHNFDITDDMQTRPSRNISNGGNSMPRLRSNSYCNHTIPFESFQELDTNFSSQWVFFDDMENVSSELAIRWGNDSIEHIQHDFSTVILLVKRRYKQCSDKSDQNATTNRTLSLTRYRYLNHSSRRQYVKSYTNLMLVHRCKEKENFTDLRTYRSSNIHNITCVLQMFIIQEQELHRTFNILHYTRCPYFLTWILNESQLNNRLLQNKLDTITCSCMVVLFGLMHFAFIAVFLKYCHPQKILSGHPWLKRKVYWVLFVMLQTGFHFFVYFPTVLLVTHRKRNELLQTLCPVVSSKYKKMIYKHYKRHQREVIRNKVKRFYGFYSEWSKAFDLKKKYVRSANVSHTFLTKKRRQLRGGRKRKCLFRKHGQFIYGKVLHKRHKFQRKTILLKHVFKISMNTLKCGLNNAVSSAQLNFTKSGKKISDAADNLIDIFRLRQIPFQRPMVVQPFLDPSMTNEFTRLSTFSNFPIDTPVRSLKLAEAGFFYTGQYDIVECFNCHVQHRDWKRCDIPFKVHKRISPSCDFVAGINTQNTSIDRTSTQSGSYSSFTSSDSSFQNGELLSGLQMRPSLNVLSNLQEQPSYLSSGTASDISTTTLGSSARNGSSDELSYDSIGFSNQCTEESLPTNNGHAENGEHYQTSSAASSTSLPETKDHSSGKNSLELELLSKPTSCNGVKTAKKAKSKTRNAVAVQLKPLSECHDRPKHMKYSAITVRMSSFKGWSSYTGQHPRELASAGFFYAGYADLVTCWFCNVRLQQWDTNDDPWIEHAKFAPTCLFLRRNNGDEFIALVHEDNRLPFNRIESNFNGIEPHTNGIEGRKENCLQVSSLEDGPKPSQTPLQLAAVVENVKAMGYQTGVIKTAIEKLQRENIPIDTYNIVDELTREDNGYCTSKSRPANVGELTWNAANQTTPQGDPCANGITAAMNGLAMTETDRLMEENLHLKKDMKCKICDDMIANITFLPCGHLICCEDCQLYVKKCPTCHHTITDRIKTWMS